MKKEITIEMDGKRYPATIEMPDDETVKTPWNIKIGDEYFYLTTSGGVQRTTFDNFEVERNALEIGNFYLTRELAEKTVELQKIKSKFTRRRIEIEGPEVFVDSMSVWVIYSDPKEQPRIAFSHCAVSEPFAMREGSTANQLFEEMGDDFRRAFRLMKELKNAGCVV